MSQQVDSPFKTLTAAGAIAANLRVKTPGALVVATASDPCIGVTQNPILAAGPATIRLRSAQGTCKMVAADAITAGNPAYAAAGGKVASTGTVIEGTALESSANDGDVIEVLPIGSTDLSTAIAGTTNPTFTVDSDSSAAKVKIDTNSASGNFTLSIVPPNLSGNRTVTLPSANTTLVGNNTSDTLTNKTLTAPTLGGNTTMADSANLVCNNTMIGTTNTGKIGFFGTTPVVQQTGIANANNNADNLAAQLNSVIAALENLGLLATV